MPPVRVRRQTLPHPPRSHQQYLAKSPFGYRCHADTGVRFPETA